MDYKEKVIALLNDETLSQEQKQKLEKVFPELAQSEDEKIRKELITYCRNIRCVTEEVAERIAKWIVWLKKQGKQDNWAEELNNKIKELHKQCLAKIQENNTPTIVWHSVSEEPEEMKELFCEWESDDATWHDVAFYDEESHTFLHAKKPINVTKWVYVDELLEKQVELKTPNIDEMKFKVGGAVSVYGNPLDYEHASITQKDFAPKVEPKFKVGDWITCKGLNTALIVNINDDKYEAEFIDGNKGFPHIDYVDRLFHLWSIADAKDGDVLTSIGFHSNCTFIFKGLDNWKFDDPNGNRAVATGYCCLSASADNMEFGIQGPDCVEVNTIKPATKIQHDLLFQKMKEAGYTWNPDEKKLEKIEKLQDKTALEALKEVEVNNANCATPKIKPKFHKGDWIINPEIGNVLQIKNVLLCGDKGNYEFDNNSMPIESVDRHYRQWTIKDAKNGDILVCEDNIPFIFKGFDRFHPECPVAYCGIDDVNHFIVSMGDGWWTDEKCYPATKEQCNFLFKKMHEAGYEWNAEKKELKKIHAIDDDKAEMDYCFTKMMAGEKVSPIWSEEDEANLNNIIWLCNNCINGSETTWIPSQATHIKSLIERIKDTVFLQPKQEWNEKDEEHVNSLLKRLEGLCRDEFAKTRFTINEDEDWLKSLRPQNKWKPSDEQMQVLLSEVTAWSKGCYKQKVLESLYNDLKKLKEE